jgi:hypothetical protein
MAERNVIKKGIELNQDDVDWFNSQYPKGSLSAVLSMLLSKFRESNTLTPSDYVKIAVDALNEDMKSK